MAECFQIAATDNVATLLSDTEPGAIAVRGEGQMQEVPVTQPIRMGHKVAIRAIGEGKPVVIEAALEKVAGEKVVRHEIESGSSSTDAVNRHGIL
ncbi:MAG: hypothetical protein ACRD25_03905 [Terracidiphilus sp.]